MAATTRWQLALRAAQIPVTSTLSQLGFRKSGNHYNRTVADGLIQVVGFQSGQAVSTLHGNFTVNVGICVPCIAELEGTSPRGRVATDAHCEIRSRLSDIAGLGKDRWWKLDSSAAATGVQIADALVKYGVPFLDRYASHEMIIDRFTQDGELPSKIAARSALSVAIIRWARGEQEEARRLFDAARSAESYNARFPEYVSSIQLRCGL